MVAILSQVDSESPLNSLNPILYGNNRFFERRMLKVVTTGMASYCSLDADIRTTSLDHDGNGCNADAPRFGRLCL